MLIAVITPKEYPVTPKSTESFQSAKRHSNCPLSRLSEHEHRDESPVLPIKQKINSAYYSSKIAELNSNAYDSIGKSFITDKNSNAELDSLMLQLSMITQEESINESSEKRSNSVNFPALLLLRDVDRCGLSS